MPNYNIVASAEYRPYTFDEMAKPLIMYKAEFDNQMKAAEALELEAAKRLRFLDPVLDKDQYDEYKATVDEINKLGEDLATNGLSSNSLSRASAIRRNFQALVSPLDYALTQREKEKELFMQLKVNHPEIKISRDPFSTPVSNYYPGSGMSSFSTVNMNDIYDKALKLSAAFAGQFSQGEMKRLSDAYYEYVTKRGLEGNPDDIINKYPQFESIKNSILERLDLSGFDKDTKKEVLATIFAGMKNGIIGSRSVSDGKPMLDRLGLIRAAGEQKLRQDAAKGSTGKKSAGLKEALDALGAEKDNGSFSKNYSTSDAVRNSMTEIGELLMSAKDAATTAEKYPELTDQAYASTATNRMPFFLPGAGAINESMERMNNAIGSKITAQRLFEPIYRKTETVGKKNEDGSYTRKDIESDIVDYKVNLSRLPEKEQKRVVDLFNSVGIEIHNGDTWKDLVKKVGKVYYTMQPTVNSDGTITNEPVENNLDFARATMYNIKLTPSAIKDGIKRVAGEFSDGKKFKEGSVRRIKGAASINGRHVNSLSFTEHVPSVETFLEEVDKNSIDPQMYYYEDSKNKGFVVRLGGSHDYFIDLKYSGKSNVFTKLINSPYTDYGKVARSSDNGFTYGGEFIPYTSEQVLNLETVAKGFSDLMEQEELKAALEGPYGYSYTAKEKEEKLKIIEKDIKKIKSRPIFKDDPSKGTIGDVEQAVKDAYAFNTNGNTLTDAFVDSYLNGFKGDAYNKRQFTLEQMMKYGYNTPSSEDELLQSLLDDSDLY